MANQRFLAKHHIRRNNDIRRAYQRRATASDPYLLVFACPNGLDHPRVGLSVSRKVGGAVRRNRWKRLIREAFRLSRQRLPEGVDLVVIPRQNAKPELALLVESLRRLARRAASRLEQNRPPSSHSRGRR
ncbi:MAG: ribonuclease P protein component [Planctomycetota bacterium]|jgi:ribonuclease P protein component